MVVATLKTELSTVPRGNGQLLLRLPPPPSQVTETGLDSTARSAVDGKYMCDRTGQ